MLFLPTYWLSVGPRALFIAITPVVFLWLGVSPVFDVTVANWVLPIVPATVGALAHQGGMVYERLARAGMPEHLPRVPGTRLLTAGTEQ